jgi:hypothetical protein
MRPFGRIFGGGRKIRRHSFYPLIRMVRKSYRRMHHEERPLRLFELTTRIGKVRRNQGKTATVAAAYISGTDIYCAYEERQHNYSRKGGVAFSAIFLPDAAPPWASDREKLWNAAELVEKNGKRGNGKPTHRPPGHTFFHSRTS